LLNIKVCFNKANNFAVNYKKVDCCYPRERGLGVANVLLYKTKNFCSEAIHDPFRELGRGGRNF